MPADAPEDASASSQLHKLADASRQLSGHLSLPRSESSAAGNGCVPCESTFAANNVPCTHPFCGDLWNCSLLHFVNYQFYICDFELQVGFLLLVQQQGPQMPRIPRKVFRRGGILRMLPVEWMTCHRNRMQDH